MRKPSKTATRRKKSESDWKTYYGSSDEMKALLKQYGPEDFRREILYFCRTRKQMSYLEEKEQFVRAVLESDTYINTNIAGRYFTPEAREPR